MAACRMVLRPASLADLALLEYWDSLPHVIAASGDDDGFDWRAELPRDVDWREMLIAEIDGRPVGFIQIIDPRREETQYWGPVEPNLRAIDIWIGEENDLGRGFGTRIMQLAIERCFRDPSVTAILIDPLASNRRARRFYERLGFGAIERRRFGNDDCVVYRLDRSAWPGTMAIHDPRDGRVDCSIHGLQPATFVCRHIIEGLRQNTTCGFWQATDTTDPRPDAWCSACNEFLARHGGEWNDTTEDYAGVSLLCGSCYDLARNRNSA